MARRNAKAFRYGVKLGAGGLFTTKGTKITKKLPTTGPLRVLRVFVVKSPLCRVSRYSEWCRSGPSSGDTFTSRFRASRCSYRALTILLIA